MPDSPLVPASPPPAHHHHGPHDHAHAHPHSPAPPLRPPLAARLFAASAARRVLIAILPLALVWLLTWWALQ